MYIAAHHINSGKKYNTAHDGQMIATIMGSIRRNTSDDEQRNCTTGVTKYVHRGAIHDQRSKRDAQLTVCVAR
jgi:hypothetical protein